MKAYLTSIGEPTTEIARQQLKRLGFEVILLGGIEDWFDKYKKFIDQADENCIRVDADVILNSEIKQAIKSVITGGFLMAQFTTYDFYRNNVGVTSPVFYTKEALSIIRKHFKKLDPNRPEAMAWRLKEINERTLTAPYVVGMHGFFQDRNHLARHLENKKNRKQMSEYDFDLALDLLLLNNNNHGGFIY